MFLKSSYWKIWHLTMAWFRRPDNDRNFWKVLEVFLAGRRLIAFHCSKFHTPFYITVLMEHTLGICCCAYTFTWELWIPLWWMTLIAFQCKDDVCLATWRLPNHIFNFARSLLMSDEVKIPLHFCFDFLSLFFLLQESLPLKLESWEALLVFPVCG